tara:strand:+ start:5929 stop:6378 length:450 start_codon:yes stop_codon:yes gene_type:complete
MKSFFLVVLMVVFFHSCSTSDENVPDKKVMEDDMGMQMLPKDDDPMEESKISYKGNFVSGAHTTTGVAAVNNAKTSLSLTDFKTDNGPVLEVYLATNTSASTYISLGVLKGIQGNYEYTLPDNVDYSVYDHVLIWCVDFKVNFGHAVLK